jgi:putative phosphoesterase
MKRIIVISDTHGSTKGIEKLLPLIAENDYVIHLGDGAGDMREVMSLYPEKVYLCAGNCDFFSPLPLEGTLDVEQLRIMYCHGHRYGVKRDLDIVAEAARAHGYDIVLYGHTHSALITEINGVTLINPGTLRYPAGEGGSYCYLVVEKNKHTAVIVGETAY